MSNGDYCGNKGRIKGVLKGPWVQRLQKGSMIRVRGDPGKIQGRSMRSRGDMGKGVVYVMHSIHKDS